MCIPNRTEEEGLERLWTAARDPRTHMGGMHSSESKHSSGHHASTAAANTSLGT